MTTIGFLGAGLMAQEIAKLATGAGVDVALANSRGPESLDDLVAALGPQANAADIPTAAHADIVVLALPLGRLNEIDPQLLTDKTVLDLTNYYPHRDGRIDPLDSNTLTAGQYVQQHLHGAHTVRAFSNISYLHIPTLTRPSGAPDRSALPMAGDHDSAKATIAALVDQLGYDTVDVGSLDESWRFEPDTAAYLLCYTPPSTKLTDLQSTPPTPADKAAIRALLERAQRTDQGARTF